MFKRLRIKFITITMVMVAVVMALAFSIVCAVEYQRSYSVVQTAMNDAAESAISDDAMSRFRMGQQKNRPLLIDPDNPPELLDGMQPRNSDNPPADDAGTGEGDSGEQDEPQDLESQDESNKAMRPSIGNRNGQPRATSSLIPVAVYRLDSSGTANLVPQVTSASISDDLLAEAIECVRELPDGYGILPDLELHYYKVADERGIYIVFADTSYTDSWKSLAGMLVLVGMGTLLVFFVISLFYSRWALKPVREAWDSQRQFVADASHDLKTPLTVVLANAAILLEHPEHSIAQESQWIESTQIEAENMQGLVNEMLELAQIEAGERIEVAKEEIDFSDLVEGETLLFDSVALERNCLFECEVESDVSVYGNTAQVKKMVSTLVENAFKYVDEGGSIDISLERKGKTAQLSISNTGTSISSEDLPHIFDRFYRTDKARTSGAGGFGLGLAIAREVAIQMGGDIVCASSEGTGTKFTVTLPVYQR